MAASGNNITLWTSSKIPFEPFDNHPAKDEIKSAMEEIENNTGIWFAKRGNEPNYLKFESNGNNSQVGMKGSQQIININDDGWWALHEICHSMGLIHEQRRSDSQSSIETYFRTATPITLPCYTIPANANGNVDPNNGNMKITCDSLNLTVFDRVSVMLYAKDMGLISGTTAPSMIWKADPNLDLGASDRKKLSALDKEGINKLYAGNSGWSSQSKINGIASKQEAALTVYNNKLYAMWNGYHNDGIFYASFDGNSWSGQSKISNVATKDAPALTVYNNKLYAAWNGYNDDGIFYASFDGNTWSGQSKISGVATKDAPALATYNNKLYAAWNGYHDDGIFYASFDGNSWSGQSKISNVATKVTPALAVYNNKLYAAWNGYNNDGIFYASFDGSAWSGQLKASDFGTTLSPSLGVYHNPSSPTSQDLFLTWRGSGDDGIWWAHFDGMTWSGQAKTDFGTQSSMGMTTFQNNLFMAWSGSGNDGIFYAHFKV